MPSGLEEVQELLVQWKLADHLSLESAIVHKLKIALKELNESCIWLKMICQAELVK